MAIKKEKKATTKKVTNKPASKKASKQLNAKALTSKKKASPKKAKKAVKKTVTRFNAKTHTKLSALADSLKMDYRSMFAKQSRLGIKASKYLENDREVLAFTKADATKIKKLTASLMTDSRMELTEVERSCKVTRSVLLRVLKNLKITPVKFRRQEDKRSVPTISKGSVPKIKKAILKSA